MDNQDIIIRYLKSTGATEFKPLAALIDMDGTLYDSMPNHATAWHTLAGELGIDTTRDEFFLYEGATAAYTLNKLFNRAFGRDVTPEEVKKHYRRKTELFALLPPISIMPGARRLLEFFKRNDTKRIVVTGSGQQSILGRLTTDFAGLIDAGNIITARDVTRGKPDPQPYLKGRDRAGVAFNQAVVIENAPLGVESGHRARAFTVGVTTGPIPRAELEKAGADIVYGSMEECAESIPDLFKLMVNTKL